jgi:hypothetical protein
VLLPKYRHPHQKWAFVLRSEVYNPRAFIPHAASLPQACAHWGRFLTAASRRSGARVSVPLWPATLSGRLPVVALVSHYLTNKLMGRSPIRKRINLYTPPKKECAHPLLAILSDCYAGLPGRSATCYSPVRHSPIKDWRVRLACLKHAASVHPEPGSNSPKIVAKAKKAKSTKKK